MLAKPHLENLAAIALVSALMLGCTGAGRMASDDLFEVKQNLNRPHTSREREAILRPKELSSIGEMAKIAGLEPLPVLGLGLVTGLGEQGGDKGSVPRGVLEEVRKGLIREGGRTFEESREMLLSRDSSVVEVRGAIEPGASFGERFNVFLRPIDAAVSLHNGYLQPTALMTFLVRDGQTKRGNRVAAASGQVTGAPAGSAVVSPSRSSRTGAVFGGGRCESKRLLFVRLAERWASGRRTVLIEYLLNRRFAAVGLAPGASPVKYAAAISNRLVHLQIPPVYRKFTSRFGAVIASIKGSYFYGSPSESELERLTERLENAKPEGKFQASVTLEGIGRPALPYLEEASGDDWTKLYSGQALAYLNSDLGRRRVIAASDSPIEDVRYEAVKFLSQLGGRVVIQALRTKVFDPSNRISIEAIQGLARRGEDYATMVRLSDFDMVALRGVDPGLIVKSSGRRMVAVAGIGTPLKGTIEVRVGEIGLGSTDDSHVGLIIGFGGAESITVEATVDNVLAVLRQYNPSFKTVKSLIAALEDAGNMPYQVRWMD